MKLLSAVFLLSTIALGQGKDDPKVEYRTDPLTHIVAHCPDGWHVERWHEVSPSTWVIPVSNSPGMLTSPDKESGYHEYSTPQALETGDNQSYVHPDRCVKDTQAIPPLGSIVAVDKDIVPAPRIGDALRCEDGKCVSKPATPVNDGPVIVQMLKTIREQEARIQALEKAQAVKKDAKGRRSSERVDQR